MLTAVAFLKMIGHDTLKQEKFLSLLLPFKCRFIFNVFDVWGKFLKNFKNHHSSMVNVILESVHNSLKSVHEVTVA